MFSEDLNHRRIFADFHRVHVVKTLYCFPARLQEPVFLVTQIFNTISFSLIFTRD